MGLINSIGGYFNKFLGGWTFGTQTDQLTVKNSVELEGTTGVIYEHTFQNKDGIVAHLDDISISLPTDTTGSVLFLNASNEFDSDGTYFNWDKVNKRLKLKGNSDTVGNVLVVESLSQNRLIIGNDGKHAINGSVSAADNLYITGDLGFTYSRADNANFFKVNSATAYSFDIQSSTFVNANGALLGIIRFSNGTAAYRFRSDIGYLGLYFGSSSSSGVGAAPSIGGGTFVSGIHSNSNNTEGYAGAVNLQVSGSFIASSPVGVNMHITLPNTSFPAIYKAANIKGTFNISSGANGAAMLNIDPIYNQTGGTAYFSGIDYNPTITALSGAHYGLLIRPNTLNGIGLGATLPTANLQIKGSATTTGSSLLVQNSSSITNFEVLNSSQSSVRIGVNDLTTIISGGSSGATDHTLRVLRGTGGINIRTQLGVPVLSSIESTNNLEIVSLDNSHIAIGNHSLLRSQIWNISQTYSALATGYGFALGSQRSEIRFGDSIGGGFGKVPYLMQVVANNRSEAGDLKINPFGGNVGIGLTNSYLVVPTATLHVKGNSDSVGSSFRVENLSGSEIFRLQNDRDVVIGGGSASTNTQVTINPFRAAGTTNHVFQVNAQGTNNFMQFINSDTNTTGGLRISRDSIGIGRRAFQIGSGTTDAFWITSNGTIGISSSAAAGINLAEISNQGLVNSSDAGSSGLYFVTSGTQKGFIFHQVGSGSVNTTQAVFQIRKSLLEAGGGSYTERLFNFNGTYDLTNGIKNLIGIDYDMTITALSGAHYGLLIRPDTLNGIGLGSTLPTATLHVKGNSGFVYENSDNTRYIRFVPGNDPLDIRTNNTGSNSVQMFIRNNVGNINLKLASASGAGYYLALGSSVAASEFAYLENGLRNFGALQVQGAHNTSVTGHNDFSAVGVIAVGDLGFGVKQSAFSIQSTHTNTSITTSYSLLRLHNNTTFTFTSGGNTVRGLDLDYRINQTAGTTVFIGIDYQPTVTSITGTHYGLLIRPSGTLNGIGHTTNLPTATWHIKGNSDSVGNMFVAENLSNTASLTIANNGVSTFNFGTGGKVYIAGAVGSGETLLEIRRTNSSSGGFIFRSGNALSQELWTTNGNMYLGTPDGSSIFMQPATGNIIMQTTLRSMTAFNTGHQVTIGTQGASVLNRWLNFGHNSSYGQVIQAVQNGSTPAVDTLSLNPFGSNVGIGAILPASALDIIATNGYNQFRLRTQYTPSATADTNGAVGDICFDDDYVYYKGTTGWKRGALATF